MQSGGARVWARMREQAERVSAALDAVEHHLPADFSSAIWLTISRGMRAQAAEFQAQCNGISA